MPVTFTEITILDKAGLPRISAKTLSLVNSTGRFVASYRFNPISGCSRYLACQRLRATAKELGVEVVRRWNERHITSQVSPTTSTTRSCWSTVPRLTPRASTGQLTGPASNASAASHCERCDGHPESTIALFLGWDGVDGFCARS